MLIELGARATVIESPTSPIKLEAYGIAPDELLRRVTTGIKYAKEHGMTVAFFAVDATRSELDFLKQVYLAALEAGADEVVVVDTIGACNPEAVEFLVGQVREWVGDGVPIHFHGHNDFGLATASAVAAVRAGATWIQVTINGMGERAGNADIGEIALALSSLYDVPVALDLGKIREVSQLVQKISGHSLDAWRPLVGENLFTRESGAVASQFHIPKAIEPYSSELVNAERSIVMGKKSGLDSIDLKCKELGLEFTAEQRPAILKEVKRKGIEKRGLLTDDEFRAIVAGIQKN
jgi:isopropylmalate/homocitrate/citramalate synthase